MAPTCLKMAIRCKLIKRVMTIGVENGGESGDTTHLTSLNPRQRGPLDGKMGSIHGS